MSGQWINCEGSHSLPSMVVNPRSRTGGYQPAVGTCKVCHKAVRLRNDGTLRVHVNTPVAREQRESAAAKRREQSVNDLLALRQELTE